MQSRPCLPRGPAPKRPDLPPAASSPSLPGRLQNRRQTPWRRVSAVQGDTTPGHGTVDRQLRYHARNNVTRCSFCLEPRKGLRYRMVILRGHLIAHPRTLVANQGSRARIPVVPQTRDCINNMPVHVYAMVCCGPPTRTPPRTDPRRMLSEMAGANTPQRKGKDTQEWRTQAAPAFAEQPISVGGKTKNGFPLRQERCGA